MKKLTGLTASALVLVTGLGVAAAQQEMGPPKVLVMQREFLKPGKGGPTHERSESAFVRAMTAAKWPTHYVGLDSMSGQPRSLFLIGYPSFAAWEKDNQAMEKNTTLQGAFDRAIADLLGTERIHVERGGKSEGGNRGCSAEPLLRDLEVCGQAGTSPRVAGAGEAVQGRLRQDPKREVGAV
jgi:hypothetical protein